MQVESKQQPLEMRISRPKLDLGPAGGGPKIHL